jgi:pectinesterase
VYASSRVQGATDFLFGQRGRAWFDGLDIRVVGGVDVGYVTASGRDAEENPSYFVINNSSVSALEFQDVAPGVYFLGRPWRDHARVVVQESRLSGVVNGKGWTQWSDKEPRTEGVLFGEFGNEGAGAEGERVAFAKKLERAVGIEEVLGEDWESWVDVSYLS